MNFTNSQIASMLREVATAYTLKKGNSFQIKAYETAADSVEHSTSEVEDLWEEGKLDEIPGIGESLKSHLEELFKTGKVKHWEDVKKGIPPSVFELLDIPGVGPKTALELAKLGVKNKEDLKKKLESNEIVKKGFSEKLAPKILISLGDLSSVRSGRMLLPVAFAHAQKILSYLRNSREVERADALGSLRRMVATIGDLDFSVSSKDPKKVVEHIIKMPGVKDIVDKGESKVTIVLNSGLHLDFLIAHPDSYGALFQHFTGSKNHNIHLRTIAEKHGLSLSEYGVKNVKTGKVEKTETEKEFYSLLKMDTPAPEIREDTGEIEAALVHELPKLVELQDIKGDLHIHSNFPIEPSHDLGVNSISEVAEAGKKLGYEYVGISDHSPSISNHSAQQITDLITKRSEKIKQVNRSAKGVVVLNLLEVDILPDGKLSVPDEGLKLLDFALAGVHSSHNMGKNEMTKRILKALENPFVKVLTHPTGRLLNQRDSFDADWEEIFKFAAKNKKAMEINAHPNRLDLPDTLARMAKSFGIKFVINTDSHEISGMENMRFGVAVARRGWCEDDDIINSWDFKKLTQWFNI